MTKGLYVKKFEKSISIYQNNNMLMRIKGNGVEISRVAKEIKSYLTEEDCIKQLGSWYKKLVAIGTAKCILEYLSAKEK